MAHKDNFYSDESEDFSQPSRSQLKRNSTATQKLGEELAALSPNLWKKFSISEDLLAALKEHLRLKSHEAKRRHLQFIGRLMRGEDAIRVEQELAALKAGHEQQTAGFHLLEDLRDRILEDEQAAWEDVHKQLASLGPEQAEEQLKTLKECAKAARTRKDKGSFRSLFRALKNIYQP